MNTGTRIVVLTLSMAWVAIAAPFSFGADHLSGASGKPHISMSEARVIALKREPGIIEGAELEHEHGKFIYSFDIRAANGTLMEVHVSAISGKVVGVTEESSQHEATERKKESREHAPAHRDHGARAQ